MSIGAGEWTLWRDGEPFPQRFFGTISEDGNTITGRWEKAEDGTNYTTDFFLTYRRVDPRTRARVPDETRVRVAPRGRTRSRRWG